MDVVRARERKAATWPNLQSARWIFNDVCMFARCPKLSGRERYTANRLCQGGVHTTNNEWQSHGIAAVTCISTSM